MTLCEELDAALAGGGVDVVLEAAALGLPAGGVVGEVLPLLARARGLLHTAKLSIHQVSGGGGGDLLEALVQGRPVVSLPLLATVTTSPSRLRVKVKQFASVTRTLCIFLSSFIVNIGALNLSELPVAPLVW